MPYLSLDYLIVCGFLLVVFVVGWRAGKGVTDMKSYALGHRAFGTAALVLTFLATEVGGQGAVNLAGEIGTTGIIVLITFLGFSLSYLVQALWIAPKLMYFPKCMTMGDVMGTLYGKVSQVIVGIFSFITAICYAGAEIIMLGVVTQSLLGLDARLGIIVGGLLLTLYVVHGGMQAVTTTDVLQFLVLLVLLPVLAAAALQQAGGIKAVLTHIPQDQLRLWDHPDFAYYLVLFLAIIVFQCNMIDPALVQRMLMARNGAQLRQMFLTLAGLFAVIFLVFMVLGTTGHQLYPTLAAEEIIPHMIKTLLPVGLRGLMVAGILAVVMASADSYLHAAGVTLVHDVLKPLGASRAIKLYEMHWVRYMTLLAGLVIIVLGLTRGEDLYGLISANLEFALPALVFPFFAGILGLKPDRRAFYISAGAALSTFILGKRYLPQPYDGFLALICVLASGVTFFVAHWVQHRGFVVVRRGAASSDEYLWQPRRRHITQVIGRMFPTPERIVRFSQQQVDRYGAPYLLFGAFCCINFTLPYFMWAHDSTASYNLMLYLRVLGGLACGLLIVRDKWPSGSLVYLPTFWHLTLIYCLPFMSTVMFLLTQGSVEWLINVAITIMFLIVLVDWLSFILLAGLGIGLGLLFYLLAVGPITLQLDFSTEYLLVYTCFFSTLIALLFSRRKEQHLEAKLREISTHYYATRRVEAPDTHPAAFRITAMIAQHVQEATALYNTSIDASTNLHQQEEIWEASHTLVDCLQYFFPTALGVIQQGDQMRQQLITVLQQDYIAPRLAPHSLQACVETVLATYGTNQVGYLQGNRSEDYEIYASWQHLQYAIIHILRFLDAHASEVPIRLWITPKPGINLRLSGQALAASLLEELFTLFPAQETTHHLGLAISRLLIEAQGGRLLYETHALSTNPYTEFIISLPIADEVPDFM